jgi:hypothetical protein
VRFLRAWVLAWFDAAEMRSPHQDGYVAGVVDAFVGGVK